MAFATSSSALRIGVPASLVLRGSSRPCLQASWTAVSHSSVRVGSSNATPRRAVAVKASGDISESLRVAKNGDTVNVAFECRTQEGEVLHKSEEGQTLTFEVGAGNFVGNPLFKGFDEAVHGLAIGESRTIQSAPMPRTEDMIFRVPREHAEVQRLVEQKGGELAAGEVAMLANNSPAAILEVTDDFVVIDANHPLAEQVIEFEVKLISFA